MPTAPISKANFAFLKELKKNNNRDWFNANKDRYVAAHENTIDFVDGIIALMRKHDDIETTSGKKSLFRIYRDTRFAKDKTPYKTGWMGSLSRRGVSLRGGYYFHIEPGGSYIGGGFYQPEGTDLAHIRAHIAADDKPLRKILKSKAFRETFGELQGEQLKTSPKGYDKDHPAIDLLRHKSMYAMRKFGDKEVLSPDFPKEFDKTMRRLRPFFDYMSEVLTTDLNGESLL
jgi:uncharacterized protein (TIGR02453 family)